MYGKGFIKSPAHKLGLGHPRYLSTVKGALPSAAEALLPPPVDQGQTSSCTGNSTAVAICAAMTKAAGLPAGQWVELPSRLFLYYNGRAYAGTTGLDDGAMISNVFDGAAALGVPPESAWPFSEDLADIAKEPDWYSIAEAADQKVVEGAHRITSTGVELVRDVKTAIALGNAVVWGTDLDNAFESLPANGIWGGVTGKVIGGHAMVLHKYDGDVFWTRSSWGSGFADGGSRRMFSGALKSYHASEFWVVSITPSYSSLKRAA